MTIFSTILRSHLKPFKSHLIYQMEAATIFATSPLTTPHRSRFSSTVHCNDVINRTKMCKSLNLNRRGFAQISLIHGHPTSLSSNPPSALFTSSAATLAPKFEWHDCNNGASGGLIGDDKSPAVTVVLLGWLGAKPRHLKRYVELYNAKGFNAVTFVASVGDVLSFDLGHKLEKRIGELASSLAAWVGEEEEDGRERVLVFHTFSNTGWMAYGAVLDNLRGRHDMLMKIKGCIVDSGAEPELNPKVWASGFVAALLKKRSSLASSTGHGKETFSEESFSQTAEEEPLFLESVLLAAFEKLFSFLFSLPDVTTRLRRVLSTLINDQPHCPQLYLYSTADKVIPSKSVEAFMEQQRKIGREVWSFNFGVSPHVDHYRTFPEIYSSQLLNFLQECLVTVKLSGSGENMHLKK